MVVIESDVVQTPQSEREIEMNVTVHAELVLCV